MKVYVVIWSECDSGYKILGVFDHEEDALDMASRDHEVVINGHVSTYYRGDIDVEEYEVL